MPNFVIERQYLVPIYQHIVVEAEILTLEPPDLRIGGVSVPRAGVVSPGSATPPETKTFVYRLNL